MQSKPITFETFAPRRLSRVNGVVTLATLGEIWNIDEQIGQMTAATLPSSIGVYVIGSKRGKIFTPWYVGKTDKGFKKRFEQHVRKGETLAHIYEAVPTDDLFVVFIARSTSPRRLKLARKPKALTKTKSLNSIKFLESDLIRACHAKNKALINTSHKVFHDGFSVPGFLGPRVAEDSQGAQALRDLLH